MIEEIAGLLLSPETQHRLYLGLKDEHTAKRQPKEMFLEKGFWQLWLLAVRELPEYLFQFWGIYNSANRSTIGYNLDIIKASANQLVYNVKGVPTKHHIICPNSPPPGTKFWDFFPAEDTEKGRKIIINPVANKQLVSAIKKCSLDSDLTIPQDLICEFESLLQLPPFFYLANQRWEAATGDNALIRTGTAFAYDMTIKRVYSKHTVPRQEIPGVGIPYTDDCTDGYVLINQRKYLGDKRDWKRNRKSAKLMVLSAKTSSELDTLEAKLGLG